MPSKDHVDGDHPPQHDAFHQNLCIADLFKALAERTSRVSPSAIENRMLIETSATHRCALKATIVAAKPSCQRPPASTSMSSERPFSTKERPPLVPSALRWHA